MRPTHLGEYVLLPLDATRITPPGFIPFRCYVCVYPGITTAPILPGYMGDYWFFCYVSLPLDLVISIHMLPTHFFRLPAVTVTAILPVHFYLPLPRLFTRNTFYFMMVFCCSAVLVCATWFRFWVSTRFYPHTPLITTRYEICCMPFHTTTHVSRSFVTTYRCSLVYGHWTPPTRSLPFIHVSTVTRLPPLPVRFAVRLFTFTTCRFCVIPVVLHWFLLPFRCSARSLPVVPRCYHFPAALLPLPLVPFCSVEFPYSAVFRFLRCFYLFVYCTPTPAVVPTICLVVYRLQTVPTPHSQYLLNTHLVLRMDVTDSTFLRRYRLFICDFTFTCTVSVPSTLRWVLPPPRYIPADLFPRAFPFTLHDTFPPSRSFCVSIFFSFTFRYVLRPLILNTVLVIPPFLPFYVYVERCRSTVRFTDDLQFIHYIPSFPTF